jgi:hypothetical protein
MTVCLLVGPINSEVKRAGTPVQLVPLGIQSFGGQVTNPDTATENLYVSIVRPAVIGEDPASGTTALVPGQTFTIPAATYAWVNSASDNHQFSAYFVASPIEYGGVQKVPGSFPPLDSNGQLTVTGLKNVLPSYVYQEYSDDDDAQAFVKAQNDLQQNYVDTFNALNLPIYTGSIISGALLDWVANGLYGYKRPWIFAQRSFAYGMPNTYGPNYFLPINTVVHTLPRGAIVADDDFYKRALTWHYMKGDGKYFNVRWLKRRIKRFLIGVNGSSPLVNETNQISVTFGANMEVTIRFITIIRNVVGGAICNEFGPNGTHKRGRFKKIPLNTIVTTFQVLPPLPYMTRFAEAVASGILELPFQFTYNVVIG